MPTILDEFCRVSRVYPDRTAIVHCLGRGRVAKIAFGDLDRRSEELAGYLTGRGIAGGDFVGIYMRRSIDHIAAILGILKAGAAFYSLNPRSTLEQVAYTARISQTPTVLVDNEALLSLRNIRNDGEAGLSLTLYTNEESTPFHQQVLAQFCEKFPLNRIPASSSSKRFLPFQRCIVGHHVALALFTSGSTGIPKGVLISHQDLRTRALTECEYYGITHEDVLLNLLPFSFDVGSNQLFAAMATGAQLVILNSWLPADIASAIKEHRVSGISAVPAIWAGVLNVSNSEEAVQALNSVRYVTISGGDLAPDQLKRLGELLQGTRIFKTYGQTETFRSGILLPSEYQQKMLSVGRPVKGTQVLILNRKGKLAAPNEEGEILHFGDGMMLGYLGDARGTQRKIRLNPLQKKSPFRQRVVFTGDIGRMDEEGYVYVLGRKDNMIKSSGYRIYPKEISDQILRHASVQDAVAFGVPNKEVGKVIYTEVQLKTGQDLTEAELKKFLSDKLPAYMIPARIIFVTSFPRTPSGKIRLSEVEGKYHE